MVKTNAPQVLILSFCLLLFDCEFLNASSTEQDSQKTTYDFYLSGNTFYHDGQYDKAIAAFRKSIALDPDYYYAHINLGAALAKTQEFKEAIQEFTFCIDKKWGSGADHFVFHFNRALARKEIGETRLALRDWATLKKLDPVRAEELQNSKDYLLMDAAYVERRNEAGKNRLFNQHKASITKGKIIVRKIAHSGKNAEEYEAMGLIEGTLEEVSSVLADYESYPKFMPNVREITVRSSTDEEAIVDYKLLLPMGFVKKYRLKFWSKTEENRVQHFWKKLPWPGLKPKETVTDTYGQWILENFPAKGNQVLAYYRVYTDPGNIPLGTGWIVDILTKKSIPNIISGTRARVKSIFH
jgi:tetratricopeptide (TPR) repeat protein